MVSSQKKNVFNLIVKGMRNELNIILRGVLPFNALSQQNDAEFGSNNKNKNKPKNSGLSSLPSHIFGNLH